MEIWFLAALGAAFGSGLAAFILKLSAKREYNSQIIIFYSGCASVLVFTPAAFMLSQQVISGGLMMLGVVTGIIASIVGIFKVYALRYIDTTIYFPLFKLVSPALAIVFGIFLFDEFFTTSEWIGLLLGLFVPLLLITKIESSRQNNLYMGVVLVLVTGFLAAVVSVLNKYGTEIYDSLIWLLVFNSIGIVIGSALSSVYVDSSVGFYRKLTQNIDMEMVGWSAARGVIISCGFLSLLFAFELGGDLGIVYTIQSMYILIPIVLSIIFYNEHWNLQKALAIVLSIAALGFFH